MLMRIPIPRLPDFSAFALALLVVGLVGPAASHPHVWITVETTVLYDTGKFTGLHHKWTFDEFYTAMAIEGLDKNNDGVYSREELAELAKVNIEGLKEFGYFTYPLVDGKDVKLQAPNDYWLEHTDGILSLHFTVSFDQPIPANAKGFAYVVHDPAFYIAFLPAKTDPVRLGQGAPESCSLQIGSPKTGGEDALATPLSVIKAVSIRCGE